MCSATKNKKKSPTRGSGASAQFPGKLHDLMTYTEREGLDHIISWVQNGGAIMVHDPEKLLEILPIFGFGQTKYRSFQRQINMWHWERILDGPFKGGWEHPYFARGNKTLCSYMSRHGFSKQSIPPSLLHLPRDPDPQNRMIQSNDNSNVLLPSTNIHTLEFAILNHHISSSTTSFLEPIKSIGGIDKLVTNPLLAFDDRESTLFEERQFHFLDSIASTPMLEPDAMFEPTPISPETTMSNWLLEPLTADDIESIF